MGARSAGTVLLPANLRRRPRHEETPAMRTTVLPEDVR